jgi:F420-non-reducing hydrogenase small subunit
MAENTASKTGKPKLKVGMYWSASCGGCDISLLEIGPHLLELIEAADIVFWPCAADFKYEDVAGYPDEHIDVLLWNGGVRSSEHEELARLLRKKSKTLVAYGSCAGFGGIPALANLYPLEDLHKVVYRENPSLDKSSEALPQESYDTPFGELTLPKLYPHVLRLGDIVDVDYIIPGCPPQAPQVWKVLQAVITGQVPTRNTAVQVGCDGRTVCDDCEREKRRVKIKAFRRPHEAVPEPEWCLLEQGFICMGPATRNGCGASCLKADLPCRGCYGASGDASDQGTSMIGALGSLLDATTDERAKEMIDDIVDPLGTLYRFSLAASHLKGRR